MAESNSPVTTSFTESAEEPTVQHRISDGKPLRVLSLDGGGYLGLASASFIKGIEQHTGQSFASTFDVFCGSSTGAIIALALANGRTGEQLEHLYKTLGATVFKRRGFGVLRPKYGNKALGRALTDEFGQTTLGDVYSGGKAALVTAFNVTTGKPRIFKTDHSPNLTRDSALPLAEVAMASAAAPYYFPMVPITNPRDCRRSFLTSSQNSMSFLICRIHSPTSSDRGRSASRQMMESWSIPTAREM